MFRDSVFWCSLISTSKHAECRGHSDEYFPQTCRLYLIHDIPISLRLTQHHIQQSRRVYSRILHSSRIVFKVV